MYTNHIILDFEMNCIRFMEASHGACYSKVQEDGN